MTRRTWILIGAFFVAQILTIALLGNGPFIDEGLYATAGVRLLLGQDDDYRWFGGCPYGLPVLLGAGYLAAGLAGARVVVAVCYSAALVFFTRFCARRFGERAASWALLVLCLNGVFFSFAHLAVYDAAALLALTACLWAVGEWMEFGRVGHALLAGTCAALAMMARHATFVVVLPLLCVPVLSGEKTVRRAHAAMASAVTTILTLAYLAITYRALLPPAARFWTDLSGIIPRPILAFGVAYVLVVPAAFAAAGAWESGRTRPRFTAAMIAIALVPPILHVAFALHVSFHKDLTFSLVFLCPFAGLALSRLQGLRNGLLATSAAVGVATLWGAAQAYWEDHSWADIRGPADFVLARIGPARRFTAASGYGWAFRMYAVVDHGVALTDVTDAWDVDRGANPCVGDYIVGIRSEGDAEGDRLARIARGCGFDELRRFDAHYYYTAPPAVRRKEVEFVVFRNPRPEQEARPVQATAPTHVGGARASLP